MTGTAPMPGRTRPSWCPDVDGPNPGTEQCSECGAIRTKNY